MIRHLAAGFALLACVITLSAQNTFSAPAEPRSVRVGIYQNPPMISTNRFGSAEGIGVDILTEIARIEGWRISWIEGTWQQTLDRLDAGSIDLMFPIAHTEERALTMAFNKETVLTNWGQVYTRSDQNIDAIPELDGMRIAVLENDIYFTSPTGLARLVRAFDVQVDFITVSSYDEVFEAINGRRADAGLVSRLFGQLNAPDNDVAPTPILMLPIEIRFALPPEEPGTASLIAAIDRHLAAMKETPNSVYHESIDRWIGAPTSSSNLRSMVMVIAALTSLLAFTAIIALLFRAQVARRTAELSRKNRELQAEMNERRRVDAELFTSRIRHSRLFHESFDPIFILAPDGTILESNEQAVITFASGDEPLTGRAITEFAPPTEVSGLQKALATLQTADRLRFDVILTKASGLPIHTEAAAAAMDADGSRIIQAVIRDVTENRMNQRALESEKAHLASRVTDEVKKRQQQEHMLMQQSKFAALGEMIGAIAHQWRQPLTTIGLYVQDVEDALEFQELDRDYIHAFVKQTMKQITYMSRTIDDFRNFFTSDKVKEVFDVCPLMSEVMELMNAQLGNNNIRCVVVFDGKNYTMDERGAEQPHVCARIEGYKGEFKQVILNLLQNARDAIENARNEHRLEADAGCVTIDIGTTDSTVSISVGDDAGGVPKDIIDRIFDPYFTTKNEGQGVGIGLYMSKIIVENNMGGTIRVENRDGGAWFIVTFKTMNEAAIPSRDE